MINFPSEDSFTDQNPPELSFNQLFVYADFIKPGKHQYIVSYENDIIQQPPPVVVEKKQFKYDSRGRILKEEKKEEAPKPKFVAIESNVRLASYHEFLGHAHL